MFVCEHPHPDSWGAIHALLRPAIVHGGDTDARELLDNLLSGHAQLWVRRDGGQPVAAAITTVHTDGTLHCQLMAGAMNDVDHLIAEVRRVAEPEGVRAFTMHGRRGWQRALTSRGWRRTDDDGRKVTMELAL